MLNVVGIYLNVVGIYLNVVGIMLNVVGIYLNVMGIMLNVVGIYLNAEPYYLNDVLPNLNAYIKRKSILKINIFDLLQTLIIIGKNALFLDFKLKLNYFFKE